MDRKHFGLIGAVLGVALVVYLVLLWQPERQVRLHQIHFLQAVEKRDWPRFSNFIANNYSDRWQHDKNYLLAESRNVFQHFFILSISSEEIGIAGSNSAFTVRERLRMEGSGSPVAQFILQRVNGLADPFLFQWQKQSWKPWAWKLTQIDQPALELPETSDL
ncbi:MAG: hypothetical protein JWL59_1920 [Chthoniobacteraceae bacterium]|nr:hypothetical protein [Chthoniobacteraceae bacterium]